MSFAQAQTTHRWRRRHTVQQRLFGRGHAGDAGGLRGPSLRDAVVPSVGKQEERPMGDTARSGCTSGHASWGPMLAISQPSRQTACICLPCTTVYGPSGTSTLMKITPFAWHWLMIRTGCALRKSGCQRTHIFFSAGKLWGGDRTAVRLEISEEFIAGQLERRWAV